MLISHELTHTPRAFLAATGLTLDELEQLLPALQMADEHKDPPPLTQEGQSRQRPRGGGATGAWPKSEAPLFFLRVSQPSQPLPTMHGLPFGVRHPPPRLAASPPASLPTGWARPRGGPRARRGAGGDPGAGTP